MRPPRTTTETSWSAKVIYGVSKWTDIDSCVAEVSIAAKCY